MVIYLPPTSLETKSKLREYIDLEIATVPGLNGIKYHFENDDFCSIDSDDPENVDVLMLYQGILEILSRE